MSPTLPHLVENAALFFQFLLLHSCSYLPAPKGYLLIIYQVTIPWCSWAKTSITLEFTVLSDILFSQKVLSWDTWQQHKASYHVMCRMGILTILERCLFMIYHQYCLKLILVFHCASSFIYFSLALPLSSSLSIKFMDFQLTFQLHGQGYMYQQYFVLSFKTWMCCSADLNPHSPIAKANIYSHLKTCLYRYLNVN